MEVDRSCFLEKSLEWGFQFFCGLDKSVKNGDGLVRFVIEFELIILFFRKEYGQEGCVREVDG